MRFLNRSNQRPGWWSVALLAVLLASVAPLTSAQEVPLDFEESGDAMPDGTVTVTVVTTDDSTIDSVVWTQVYGVDAALTGADTATVTAALGTESAFKGMLIHVLEEPPITPEQLPPNVPPPGDEFYGGLQDRFEVVGLNHFALEEAGMVKFEVDVVTSSGTYQTTYSVHAHLPWKVATGLVNVPIGRTVLMQGKTQDIYDWVMTPADGSAATLMDARTQNPEFTPDVAGIYSLTVTDVAAEATVEIDVYAGTWLGIITGQDAAGNPTVDASCNTCHGETVAKWAATGHAEIFSNNLDTSTHYGEGCFDCHTVGFDPDVDNGGIDDASDYQAFLDSGLINNPGDNWATVLAEYPETARHANIQCENCHGPQEGEAHRQGVRGSISSNVCASCHGEPLRHARFQQWQLSKHADYELAVEEGQSGNCSRCHTGNGFLAWLPVLTGMEDGDPYANVEVTWTEDETHPQTCVTCHNPHDAGDLSGNDNNATVWISGDTPPLLAGFTATDVGRGAICMTCHNTRRGLRNDSNFDDIYRTSEAARAPHGGAQTDVVMGQNAYFTDAPDRGFHSNLQDTCATCHMEATDPPPDLAYNLSGTNHTFYASNDICASCHNLVTAEDVQGPTEEALDELQGMIEAEILALMDDVIAAGNSIDLGGAATITSTAAISEIMFTEYHGRQAIEVTMMDATVLGPMSMNDVEVVPTDEEPYDIYDDAAPFLPKSGWNYLLFHNDGSLGVHNPSWTMEIVEDTMEAIEEGGGSGPGPGDGANAVACTSDYVYWTEIAAAAPGLAGSLWRTDVVLLNQTDQTAMLEFILHQDSGDVTIDGNVNAGSQGVFEDIVGLMNITGKGALEICSDQPLQAIGRIYNLAEEGSFGQFLDGIDYSGMSEGDAGRLLGLRQMTDEFRTNITVTNSGMAEAEVEITLFSTDGTELETYSLMVGSGMVVQDIEPFKTRANAPDVGWGFARVLVVSGNGVITSASVVDSRTNDATTIPMKN